jgi:stearoyl-CoA desaturase (delta-9 desaturase)
MRFLERTFLHWQLVAGAACFFAGWLIWDLATGVSFLVYGMFVRLVYVVHVTWLINSATHIWGYRNYETRDDSRNSWWVALLSYGEGWHNNHHAYQRMARHGHRWWELDVTWLTISTLRRLGCAWDIVDRPPLTGPSHQAGARTLGLPEALDTHAGRTIDKAAATLDSELEEYRPAG